MAALVSQGAGGSENHSLFFDKGAVLRPGSCIILPVTRKLEEQIPQRLCVLTGWTG